MNKQYPLDIVMFVPGMQMNWDSLEKQSLGGSESIALQMSKELAKLKNNVTAFCNTTDPGKKSDDVTYLPLDGFGSYATCNPHDVLIAQRMPEVFATRMPNKLNLLWCHDLAQGRNKDRLCSVLWNIDKIMTVSQYMTNQYKEVTGLPDEAFWTTKNGINLSITDKSHSKNKRNRKQLVYTARPERGLDVLLEKIMPRLWEQDPEISLVVATYNNTVPHMVDFYNYINGLIAQNEPRVKWAGHLTKQDLYKLYSESGMYVYPTPSKTMENFREVSCITLQECMAMGLPVVSSNNGALPETLHPEAGILIEGDPWTEAYQWEFVNAVMAGINDDVKWQNMSRMGKKHSQELGVKELAEGWHEEINKLIRDRNQDPIRLALHFVKHSDIIAAKKTLKLTMTEEQLVKAVEIEKDIDKNYGFMNDPLSFKQHYKEMGIETDERLSKQEFTEEYFDHSDEKRFKLIEECLRSNEGLQNILDHGTGHGWHSIFMERKLGRKWVGTDVDPGAIKWSEYFRDKYAKHPENMNFVIGDHTVDLSMFEKFDCLIMSEVLEHCVDPKEVVESMEKWVKKDGTILITVPYGPREYPDFERITHRNHIHELDFHSLREMFGKKPGVEIIGMYETHISELEEPAGFYFIRYRADHEPLGAIDWDRKLSLQRPRQTVSVSMIVGPNAEETLHWCIRSWKDIADEVIISDCGMSEEALRIIMNYPSIKILPGVDPKQVGFDEARNLNLRECKGDWVFWIDSDEKLLDSHKLHKYLRENTFQGYSIRQHHFATDTNFKPDLPVRLFRNRLMNGKEMKWYGHVHEHPEFGLNEGPGYSIVLSDLHIAHVGYLIESGRRNRFWRNNPLLNKSNEKYPDRILNKHFIMRDNMLLCTYELQQNSGRISEDTKKRCQETIELFRKYFMGKGGYLSTDSIEYYSQACRLLGLGLEVTFCVNVSKDGVPQPDIKQYRFANEEDLMSEMSWIVKDQMGLMNNKWY